jgi:NitT/TauT family transport system substrate-binding protein
VTKNPEIKQTTDLKGKMIGMAPAGSAGAAYTKSFLSRNYSLEPSGYRSAGGGEARLVQLLVQGEVDAALLREVTFVQMGQRLGLRSLADQRVEWERIAGKDAVPPLGVGVVQDRILATRRQEAVAFTAAIMDGIRTGAADPALVSDVMARTLKLPPEEAKAYADTWSISFHGKFEDADVASMDAAQKLFVLEGSLKVPAEKSSFDQSVYRDAVKLLSRPG